MFNNSYRPIGRFGTWSLEFLYRNTPNIVLPYQNVNSVTLGFTNVLNHDSHPIQNNQLLRSRFHAYFFQVSLWSASPWFLGPHLRFQLGRYFVEHHMLNARERVVHWHSKQYASHESIFLSPSSHLLLIFLTFHFEGFAIEVNISKRKQKRYKKQRWKFFLINHVRCSPNSHLWSAGNFLNGSLVQNPQTLV